MCCCTEQKETELKPPSEECEPSAALWVGEKRQSKCDCVIGNECLFHAATQQQYWISRQKEAFSRFWHIDIMNFIFPSLDKFLDLIFLACFDKQNQPWNWLIFCFTIFTSFFSHKSQQFNEIGNILLETRRQNVPNFPRDAMPTTPRSHYYMFKLCSIRQMNVILADVGEEEEWKSFNEDERNLGKICKFSSVHFSTVVMEFLDGNWTMTELEKVRPDTFNRHQFTGERTFTSSPNSREHI